MRMSRMFLPTLKEVPGEAETVGHQLMLRAGLMRKLASGVYSYLPLGYRVIRKVERIVREEMDAIGSQELLLPALNPAELWKETGRWEEMGDTMWRLKDRHNRDFCLGMTHEEVITDIARREVRSYRELPLLLYQIQTKYRDEPRPRGGLIRAREFIMKDLYSFHRDTECLEKTYQDTYRAYSNVFRRCGLDFRVVLADPGPIGGSESHEFMALCDSGEDTIFLCSSCTYGATDDLASFKVDREKMKPGTGGSYRKVETPDIRTIEELVGFLGVRPEDIIKTIIYRVDGRFVAVMVRGDREINEWRLKKFLGAREVVLSTHEEIQRLTGAPMGFSGPVGLKGLQMVADHEIGKMKAAVTGANEEDVHLVGVEPLADFNVDDFADIRKAVPGDACPRCGQAIEMKRGVELGHIFKLGTKYSEPMKATFLDEKGEQIPFIMGCYGIGVSRIVAVAVEQFHDEDGIIWPVSIAPYHVAVLPILSDNPQQMEMAEGVYNELGKAGIETVIDDRDLRPGVKFKDLDLAGFPLRLTIGEKAVKTRKVEFRLRRTRETFEVERSQTLRRVNEILAQELALLS